MGKDVFISHATKDQAAALALADALLEVNLTSWMAPRDIATGSSWPVAIREGIRTSRLVVVLVTSRSLRSEHVSREVGIASSDRLPILPIRLEDVPLEGDLEYYLSTRQLEDALNGLNRASAGALARRISSLLEPVQAPSDLEHLVPAPETAENPPPPPPSDPYAGRVSRDTPVCMVFLVDCSNSMHNRIGGSVNGEYRRVLVARTINDVLGQLERASLGDEGHRHYFDVAVLGYGLGEGREVASLLQASGDLVSISEIATSVRRWEEEPYEVPRADGTTAQRVRRRAIWVEPTANRDGHTVAGQAFARALDLVEDWAAEHPKSFPPIVLNITDGRYDRGEDPAEIVRAIQEVSTNAGNTLVFNCHLSDARTYSVYPQSTLFPSDDIAAEYVGPMRTLYDQSSRLPDLMLRRAREKGYAVADGARGYAYNVTTDMLVDFLEVGTVPQQVRR